MISPSHQAVIDDLDRLLILAKIDPYGRRRAFPAPHDFSIFVQQAKMDGSDAVQQSQECWRADGK